MYSSYTVLADNAAAVVVGVCAKNWPFDYDPPWLQMFDMWAIKLCNYRTTESLSWTKVKITKVQYNLLLGS